MSSFLCHIARLPRRFRTETGGVTAIEFGLVGLPFCLLLFVIIEIGMVAYVQSTLDDVAVSAARQIMTGQVQGARLRANQYKNRYICPQISGFLSCAKVSVNVFPLASGPGGSDAFFDQNGRLLVAAESAQSVCPGNAGDLTYLQISYAMPMLTGQLSPALPTSNGKHVIVSGRPIKNEPFIVNRLGGACAS
ncbi:MAG: pilus assembly protein [Beijerinckiaceae bacterium]|jgi:hypothetical protein|nr:pilus assembly protein [Beijerinckiaceae bacterium]